MRESGIRVSSEQNSLTRRQRRQQNKQEQRPQPPVRAKRPPVIDAPTTGKRAENSRRGRGAQARVELVREVPIPFVPTHYPPTGDPVLPGKPPLSDRPMGQPSQRANKRVSRQPQRKTRPSGESISLGERQPRSQRSRQKRPTSAVMYVIRLLILGVGIGVIAGTLLSTWDPTSHASVGVKAVPQPEPLRRSSPTDRASMPMGELKLGQEMTALKAQVQTLSAQNLGLLPGVFLFDTDTGAYLDFNGTASFAAASMIKVPVLIAFFQDVDAGKIRLDEKLILRPELIASGSGDMQYQSPGTEFTALETATQMIVISDNSATNMLIARMGGQAALNQRFQSWGLTTTVIRNLLPDLEGTNTTSPKELVHLMQSVSQGELISLRARDRLLEIMRQTVTDTLLPRGLDTGATIAHKTGDIGSLVGDVGLIDMPNGKRYMAVAMVKRPHNDDRAQELIRQVSRAAYKYLSRPVPSTPAAVVAVPTPQAPTQQSLTTQP